MSDERRRDEPATGGDGVARPTGAPDPLADSELMAALGDAKKNLHPGEDPLFYKHEEDARRGLQGEEGERVYVQPKTVPPLVVPRDTLSRVKVTDPSRRQPTLPAAKRAAAKTIEASTEELPSAPPEPVSTRPPPPSISRAPVSSSGSPSRRVSKHGWTGGAIAIGLGVALAVMALWPKDEAGSGTQVATTGAASTGAATTGARSIASAPRTAASQTEPAPNGTGMSAVEPTSGGGPLPSGTAAVSGTSTKPAPKLTADPYFDAGALPKPSASVQPTAAPVVTGSPSSAPSSKPSTTIAPPEPTIPF